MAADLPTNSSGLYPCQDQVSQRLVRLLATKGVTFQERRQAEKRDPNSQSSGHNSESSGNGLALQMRQSHKTAYPNRVAGARLAKAAGTAPAAVFYEGAAVFYEGAAVFYEGAAALDVQVAVIFGAGAALDGKEAAYDK